MTISNIASAINAAHAGVEAAKRESTRHAIECGRLLIEAKETVGHGGWDAWIRQHCEFSPRTAQLYMRLHRDVVADPAKAQRVADLSLREAVGVARPERQPLRTPVSDVRSFEADAPATPSQVLVALVVRFTGLTGMMRLLHAMDASCSPKAIGREIQELLADRSDAERAAWDRAVADVFDKATTAEVKRVIFDAWQVAA